MKEIIFSRKDAKTAKVFLGELCAFARVIIEIRLICKDVVNSDTRAHGALVSPLSTGSSLQSRSAWDP